MASNEVKKDLYLRLLKAIMYTGRLPEDKTKQGWYYYTKTLKTNGLIDFKDNSIWVLTDLAKRLIENNEVKISNLIPLVKPNTSIRKRNIASHGFGFTLKLPKIPNWGNRFNFFNNPIFEKRKLNTGVLRVIVNGCKTHIGNKSIVVHFPTGLSYFSESGAEGQRMAIEDFVKVIRKIESILGVELRIKGKFRFKIFRKHQAHVGNIVAKKCNIEGKNYRIRREDGGVWLEIDYSGKVTHAECVDPTTCTYDIDMKIKPLFDEVDRNPKFMTETVSDVRQMKLLIEDLTEMVGQLQKQNLILVKEVFNRKV